MSQMVWASGCMTWVMLLLIVGVFSLAQPASSTHDASTMTPTLLNIWSLSDCAGARPARPLVNTSRDRKSLNLV